ncbi:ABC transporter permease [Faecalimonas umbilicata]|jgi:putative ABC transport system permease protein|uniref:ABC transporter permease n=2 Tax=Faecalimonas umbilicata TaxID=1912855 RepID=UPI000E42C9EF|nr:FtsX-like permease family protein [Faecalimonas umbilicata]RGC79131.1 ABC transporter permease [Lachnospiraceae bacterium AM25-17]RJU64378.1 ABC transporter permease [Coprococcus sp. AM27-12LB]
MLKLAWKYMRYYKSQTFAIFASILLTASLLSGISSLIYSSQKSNLANGKTIYGDWHYYIETDKELYNSVKSGEKGNGYTLEQCGKMEIRDVVAEEFMICFIHSDETYRQMAHRDLLEGTFPKKENEIAADGFVLSNLGFSGKLGDSLRIGEKEYIVTGVLKSEWAASSREMEVFVSDAFRGRGRQTFLYLRFNEDKKLYKQLDAFLKKHKLPSELAVGNDEVTQYLGGEAPRSIYEIVKTGLKNEEGKFTYIVLSLQSDYNLAYNGMVFLLCLFSLFVVYSVFSISVSKRTSAYGILQTLGISEAQIGGTLLLELWMLFFIGYPLGCFWGNGLISLVYQKLSNVFSGKGIGGAETGLSVTDHTLAEGVNTTKFFVSVDAMVFGFVFLLISLALVSFIVVRSLRKYSLRAVMNEDTSFTKRRKIYALRNVNMANVVVRKFMFANKRKVIGIILSLSIGGCIFLCTTYMVENLKVHAELSLISDDGLGSEYRISLKSNSLKDTIPEAVADKIKNMSETADVSATKYTMGELQFSENEFLSEEVWRDYFRTQNQEPYFIERYDGICNQQEDGNYRIKYNVYGYDETMIEQLQDFILEGEVQPETIKNNNQVIVTANMDGQGNYYFYGKKPGDKVTLRVPKKENYTDELLKFQSGEENYIEKEFEIAAIISRPLAQEKDFLNTGVWKNAQSVIMTGEQMEENFGITDYGFINASPADVTDAKNVSNQLLQVIRDIPKAVLQDYTSAIATQKEYLKQQQIFFSSIAIILLIISLFHIINSMNHTILSRRREYGIIRAMGITDSGFYKMILQTGILYGLLTDVFIYLLYNRVLRRVMNYYMAHVLQFLHLTSNVPNLVLIGIMVLNVVIAVAAVMFPAWKMGRENIIDEIRG